MVVSRARVSRILLGLFALCGVVLGFRPGCTCVPSRQRWIRLPSLAPRQTATTMRAVELADATTIALSDLVSATEVYLPIFIAGVTLAFSGFGSAMVLGSLIDDDNVDEVRPLQFNAHIVSGIRNFDATPLLDNDSPVVLAQALGSVLLEGRRGYRQS